MEAEFEFVLYIVIYTIPNVDVEQAQRNEVAVS